MSVKLKLKRALSSAGTAQRKLNAAKHDAEGTYTDIAGALKELEEAESQIRRAIRNLPEA